MKSSPKAQRQKFWHSWKIQSICTIYDVTFGRSIYMFSSMTWNRTPSVESPVSADLRLLPFAESSLRLLDRRGLEENPRDSTGKIQLGVRALLVAPGLTTRNKKLLGAKGIALLLGARTLLVAPGLTTRNKKLPGAKGIATRSKDATSSSWPYY